MTDVFLAPLFLAPQCGHDAAALCERAASELAAHAQACAVLADGVGDGWLGDCEEGGGWARLLQERAVGANSLRWLLDRHCANLMSIADQFRSTTGPYGDADDAMGRRWRTG